MRDMVFLSHANPEDNEFTRWLSLQLGRQGYPVWCDLTKLLGGEDFWKNAEQAIRERTAKFLYVLSTTSNTKDGPLQELTIAQNAARDHKLHDFIVPLLIDELPHREINIQMARLNAISFRLGWARGLQTLLEKLELDGIAKGSHFTADSVSAWWRTNFSADAGVSDQPQQHLSNWFPIQSPLPPIWFHALTRSTIGKVEVAAETLPYAAFQHNRFLVSFADGDDFKGKLGPWMLIESSQSFLTEEFLAGIAGTNFVDKKGARNFISRLLKDAWIRMIRQRALPTYDLANEATCFYFEKGFADNDEIWFDTPDGDRTYRALVGYKTLPGSEPQDGKRYWHFGVQAKPLLYPVRAYIIKSHVLFSDDGKNIWEAKKTLHKARRSQCRNWWNPEWRDRMLAAMAWLSNDEGKIAIPVSSTFHLKINKHPLNFLSPVSYVEPGIHEEDAVEDEEEDDEGLETESPEGS